jgi:hypothetical protein
MPIRSKAGDKTPSPLQSVLKWPGMDETCPQCPGARQVYYLHTSRPGIEIVDGRRIVCLACAGASVVQAPVHGEGASP